MTPDPVVAGGAGATAGETIDDVAAAARACTVCAASLPLGPRPVFRISATARVLIVGQAPGTKVHASGIFDTYLYLLYAQTLRFTSD
ncbi:hypothetical protein Acry_0812 [Acidiphilium cryptum JF-5]|uniref:Uracil-DNA glycosylase-like domain-containing protein n=1 Tax=Acidiphilium cryptum (strain JF-5) TaxID=349163 RepID=A5FWP9_ACICJ|nr:hypothetical protein Acry_0812 [Acidiphilium cryptum JF-5]